MHRADAFSFEHTTHHVAKPIRIPHDNPSLPMKHLSRSANEFHNRLRKDRRKTFFAARKPRFVFGMKTISVFIGTDTGDDLIRRCLLYTSRCV